MADMAPDYGDGGFNGTTQQPAAAPAAPSAPAQPAAPPDASTYTPTDAGSLRDQFRQTAQTRAAQQPAAPAQPGMPGQQAAGGGASQGVPAGVIQPGMTSAEKTRALLEHFQQRGYDTTPYENDDQFFETYDWMSSQLQSLPELQQMARYGRDYLTNYDEFQQWQAQRQQAAGGQAAGPEQSAADEWKPADFDPAWQEHVRWDPESGQYVPKNAYSSPKAAEGMNAWRRYQHDTLNGFLRNPRELLEKSGVIGHITEQVRQEYQQAIQQQFGSYMQQQQVGQYLAQHEAELYEHDQQGRKLVDQNGQPILTNRGRAHFQLAAMARQQGARTPGEIMQFVQQGMRELEYRAAMQELAAIRAQQQQAGAHANQQQQAGAAGAAQPARNMPSPQQVNAERKETFMQKAARGAAGKANERAHAATSEPAEVTQGQDLKSKFKEVAKKHLVETGRAAAHG